MTDRVLRPDGTGFYLVGGELTVAGVDERTITVGRPTDFSVTAGLFGAPEMGVLLASWSSERPGDVDGARAADGRTVLPLRTRPLMLSSLPSSVRVQLRTAAGLHDTEGAWRLVLHFRNHAGSGLTWQAGLPTEAFETGWLAPLADLMTLDGADGTSAQSPDDARGVEYAGDGAVVGVVHHPEDEYYELLVDGQQVGLLVYHVIGSRLTITHTVIEPRYRGRGLSWTLVGGALDDIRMRSVTVSNYCPVVERFVQKNPQYRDLLSPAPAAHQKS
jgi:predicted GNAT family acetyltransferase